MTPEANDDLTLLRPRAEMLPAVAVPGTPAVIGRGRDVDVTVDDDSVSDRHARLEHRDGRWWITDLGSTNGTRVNGARLEPGQPHPLDDGTEIRLGGFVATLEPGAAVVEAVPAAEDATVPVDRRAFRIQVWMVLVALLVIALLVIVILSMGGTETTVSVAAACGDAGARAGLAPPPAPALAA